MSIITFTNVSKYFGSDLILDHVSFNINLKERVALIGNNGTGKTTIFKLILKELEPSLLPKEDKPGEISILSNLKIGYLDQNAITNIENKVYDELLLAFKETLEIENKINQFKNIEDNLEEYNKLIELFEKKHGYTYQNEIKDMISRFSFPESILEKQIKELSGGERMKIAFIKILLFNYDVLLLDEPTNHLDELAKKSLQEAILKYEGALILVSHDESFYKSLDMKIIDVTTFLSRK